MICSLCNGEIEVLRNKDGVIVYTEGHNAAPLGDGRCCDTCNMIKVIPARIQNSAMLAGMGKFAREAYLEQKDKPMYKDDLVDKE